MRTTAPSIAALLVLMVAAVAPAQHKPRSSDDLARDYNQAIQPINDQIDDLGNQLRSGSATLTMNEAAKIINQQSTLRRKADDLWAATDAKINSSFKETRDAITNYNAT